MTTLTYHRILPNLKEGSKYFDKANTVSVEIFEKQLSFLSKHYNILSIKDFLFYLNNSRKLEPRSILLTFDDGSVDCYNYAFPILKKYNLPAIVFLATGYIGTDKVFWWDKIKTWLRQTDRKEITLRLNGKSRKICLKTETDRIKAYGLFDEYMKQPKTNPDTFLNELKFILGVDNYKLERSAMNWEEVKEMQNFGISFGAHTVNHVNLARLDYENALLEIKESKEIIEDKLGERVKIFAYPYGGENDFLPIHVKIMRDLGFEAAFSSIEESIEIKNPFKLGRIHISGYKNLFIFKVKLTNFYPKLIRCVNLTKQLIAK
ncbi:MAG: polysaccharide deacetylase family protein [Candidatus Omnitrophica bacterium]|nr:polysaccharide deacetylase family protein [Candidatus Omnitrophota bacterium]MDD5352653.1 polysaccharide deacetylase family protein [Candidatus Omnitrophota bacterium]MDD5550252.1 polysaccharide deacetylase family protein [Candidatus Omnitrophota bacterium]